MRKKSIVLKGFLLAGALAIAIITSNEKSYAADVDDLDMIAIDTQNFEDQVFIDYLNEYVDTNKNGFIDSEERQKTTKIWLNQSEVKSLKGIKLLKELRELECGESPLVELDVSGMTSLEKVFSSAGNLEKINVTGCTNLNTLYCFQNKLTKLDVTTNVNLKDLYCSKNNIKEIDLSQNALLSSLRVDENPLVSLNAANKEKLITLSCDNCGLKTLECSACPWLKNISCNQNKLQNLNISDCPNIENLKCKQNLLSKMDVTGLPKIQNLDCSSNKIKELKMSACKALRTLYCDENELTQLDVSGCAVLMELRCSDNHLTSIDVEKNYGLTSFFCEDNSYEIELASDATFDLSTLPGELDVERFICDMEGVSLEGNILTVANDLEQVKYSYLAGGVENPSRYPLKFTLIIKRHNHTYKDVVVKATLTKDGLITPTCECGATKKATVIRHPESITLSKNEYIYDGKEKKPVVSVKDTKGKTIDVANYKIKYDSDRKNVGSYSVTVTFQGRYKGTKTLKYTILPPKSSIKTLTAASKSFKMTWKAIEKIDGYEIQYCSKEDFNGTIQKKKITDAKKTATTVKELKGKKEYFVRIRTYKTVGDKKYNSQWSAVKKVTTQK